VKGSWQAVAVGAIAVLAAACGRSKAHGRLHRGGALEEIPVRGVQRRRGIPAEAFPDEEGFDGRVLGEAFTQFDGNANPSSPTVCGRF